MNFKVIAIGNILMEDDGIGIRVLEKIEDKLKNENIKVVIGETDAEYCISQIEDGDFVFIIDASCNGKVPGTITIVDLEDCNHKRKYYTQHSYSVLDLIKLYSKSITGFIIEIEASRVSFNFGLNFELQNKLEQISSEVLESILLKVNAYREGGR